MNTECNYKTALADTGETRHARVEHLPQSHATNPSVQNVRDDEPNIPQDVAAEILSAFDDAVLVIDHQQSVTYMNSAARAMLMPAIGARFADAIGANRAQRRNIEGLVRNPNRHGFTTELTIQSAWNSRAPIEVQMSFKRRNNRGYIVLIRDVTQQKATERALRELAIRDDLTHCFNRRYFIAALDAELERHRRYGHPITLLLVDVDHFKQVNDSYGHVAGDRALQTLARVGTRVFRENDVFARLGGEEFAVLLPETDVEHGKIIAERFRTELAQEPISGTNSDFYLTVSIGATATAETMTSTAALKSADDALYRAKGAGRNQTIIAV